MIQLVQKEVFMARLKELLPSLAHVRLEHLNTLVMEDALRTHQLEPLWSWEPVTSLDDLLQHWSLEPDEVVLVACPDEHDVFSLTRDELDQASARQPHDPLSCLDLIVLGTDTRFLGLFDARFKHTHLRIERIFPDPLHFYSIAHEFGELSNFAPYPIHLDSRTWPTSEHYFQAQKFAGTPHEDEVRRAHTPMDAARFGRQRHRPLRKDWESVKIQVMRAALEAKFTQHPELRELLLITHPVKIVERTPRDAFWGDGGDGRGHNWLGRLLMELRDRLRSEETR